YKLDVVEIPTNRPVKRIDIDDEVYRTAKEKYKAIIADIEETHRRGQPVLVGTVSIEKSEYLSGLLKQRGIPHQVLNARYHEQEATIVAQAGVPGAVTIATNMAGRGTDIQLGGNLDMRLKTALKGDETPDQIAALKKQIQADIDAKKQVALAAGGLYVLGTERHESRRIDNQLRGRTGRQGDPGKSKFYICLEDDLLRIFAADRLDAIMRGLGIQEGEAIVHPWMNKALETSQRRVEQRNFEIRKNLLKYDDVINDQRKAVFEQRQEFMEATDLQQILREFRSDTINDLVARHLPPKAYAEQWDVEGLNAQVRFMLGLELPIAEWAAEEGIANEEIEERIVEAAEARVAQRDAEVGEHMRNVEKSFMLQTIDMQWREHLMHIDHLRTVIGLRGYGQRDPLNEFKTEAFTLFEKLLVDLRQMVTRWLMTVEFQFEAPPQPPPRSAFEVHLDPVTGQNEMAGDLPEGWEQTGRNQPCPCGSGKKFKHCHGALV
ncbi:MAG: SEC-C metal-binding domain-containing protein, partial [Phenylobacterium sp.]